MKLSTELVEESSKAFWEACRRDLRAAVERCQEPLRNPVVEFEHVREAIRKGQEAALSAALPILREQVLRELIARPPIGTILAIRNSEWPGDKDIAKEVQRKPGGLDVVPPETNSEVAYGQWVRAIRAYAKAHGLDLDGER